MAKHTVRAVNPAPAPKKGGRAGITPWSRSKTGAHLIDSDIDYKISVVPLPEKKSRWYIEVRPVGDRAKSMGKGVEAYIGEKAELVRDRGRALAWTSEAEAMEIAEKAMRKIQAAADTIQSRASNPKKKRASKKGIKGRKIPIDRAGYCVKPTVYIRDGKVVERDGYCVGPKKFQIEDKGNKGVTSFGAKSGPRSGHKIDPKTGKPYRPLIQRKGKLGGPGYSKKSQKDRRNILTSCVNEYGYRSCLGSLQVLLRSSEIHADTRKTFEADKKWMVKTFGGEGSFGPEANPTTYEQPGEWDHEYGELQLYIDNDYQLYEKRKAIEKNLAKKMERGTYDAQLAPAAWMHLVDEGAKKYAKEFGVDIRKTFPKKKVREVLSKEYARGFESEYAMHSNPAGRRDRNDWMAIAREVSKHVNLNLSSEQAESVAASADWETQAMESWWSDPESGTEVWSILEWIQHRPKHAAEDVYAFYGRGGNPAVDDADLRKIKNRVLR